MLLHPGAVLTQWAAQLIRTSLTLPRPLLCRSCIIVLGLRLPLDRGRVGGHRGVGGGGDGGGQGGGQEAVIMEDRLIHGGRGGVGILGAAGVQRITVSAQRVILLILDCRV